MEPHIFVLRGAPGAETATDGEWFRVEGREAGVTSYVGTDGSRRTVKLVICDPEKRAPQRSGAWMFDRNRRTMLD
jgi:hypothetical protein